MQRHGFLARHADAADEPFRALLLQARGKAGLTQRELADRVGVHVRSVQAWEAGVSYPGVESLRNLIAAYLAVGAFNADREVAEARAFWTAARDESVRPLPPFDSAWFTTRVRALAAASTARAGDDGDDEEKDAAHVPVATSAGAWTLRSQDWGEAPDVLGFLGRLDELSTLTEWVLAERARVVAVLGMGGIGKTMLAARLALDVVPSFERIYWRSVRNAPPVVDWLGEAISFLSDQRLVPPAGEQPRLMILLDLLRERRHLLILDNLEVLLQSGQRDAVYRDGYTGYGDLIATVGRSLHQSCLLLTSREAPPELSELAGEHGRVHELELAGFNVLESQKLLSEKRLNGDTAAWTRLVSLYGGNGLALKVVGHSIHQLFGGEIDQFLDHASNAVFGEIKHLLASQIARLSALEWKIMRWLAVKREPATFAEIATDLGPGIGRGALLEALEALRRRSMIERTEWASAFTLQSAVLEYVTDRLVEQAANEIATDTLNVLVEQPLIMAKSTDLVRASQEQLILKPACDRLQATLSGRCGAEQTVLTLLDKLRREPREKHGYAPGNLVNILRVLRGDLRGLDLSQLTIQHAFLQDVAMQDASLAGSALSHAALSTAFNYPTSVALSSDGTILAVGTISGEICLWRSADRRLMHTMRGHTSMIIGLALSPNGRLVASGSHDGTVRLWNSSSGHLVATLPGQRGPALSIAVSDDEQLIASGGFDGTVRVWDTSTHQTVSTIQAHASRVRWIAFGGDSLVASGGTAKDGAVRVWDARSGQLVVSPQVPHVRLASVGLSRDGRLLATGGEDGTIRLWDLPSGDPMRVLQAHTDRVWNLALSRDGRIVASGGEDGAVRLWNVADGRPLATVQGHTGTVYGVALSGTGDLVASGSLDGLVQLSDAHSGRVLSTMRGHAYGVRAVALGQDCSILASGGEDATVRLWNPATGQLFASLRPEGGGLSRVALSGNGRLAATAHYDGTVRLWDTRTGQALETMDGHTSAFCGVALNQNGTYLASGGVDGTARIWDATTGLPIATLTGHEGMVHDVAFSRSGGRCATSCPDGVVRLWDIPNGRLLALWDGHIGGVCAVALEGDGRFVVSGGYDATVRVWDGATGKAEKILQGHTATVWQVAVSDDGRTLASSSADGTVRIWDAPTGGILAILRGHIGDVWATALSRDGQLVASAGADGSVRLWQARTGECLRVMRADRAYERLDISGLTGVSDAERDAMLAQGAVERRSR